MTRVHKFSAVIFAVCYQLRVSNTDYYYHLGLLNYDQNFGLNSESKNILKMLK